MKFSPDRTPQGKLPPMEVAKAIAYEQVIADMEEHLGKTCWELTGKSRAALTAAKLKVKGGGKPGERRVKKIWEKAKKDPKWFVGQAKSHQGGRPPTIAMAQKRDIANKAMELKKEYIAPTPEKIRILLPKSTINKKTKSQSVISPSGRSPRQCVMMRRRMTHGSSSLLCSRIA